MQHYVYRIEALNPVDERKYYYGKHSGSLADLGKRYFTSSKKLKAEFKRNPDQFKCKIVKVFGTPQEALRYEGLLHRKLDVQRHPLFFNEQNQTLSGKLDRTRMITVIINETQEQINIEKAQFDCDLHTMLQKGTVYCKDKTTKVPMNVTSKEFHESSELVGINHEIVHAIDARTRKRVMITSDEFYKNREKYKTHTDNRVACIDLITKRNLSVDKTTFDNSPNLVGIRHGKKSELVTCEYCGRDISFENIGNHHRGHNHRKFYVTDNDNENTTVVTERVFYTELKETHYITASGMTVYKDGKKVRKRRRKTGKLKKQECPICKKLIGGIGNFNTHTKNHEKTGE